MDDNKVKWTRKVRRYLRDAFSWLDTGLMLNALLIMDITKPEGRLANALIRLYFRDLMPRLTRLMTGSQKARCLMEYYWETLDQMVEPERVLAALAKAGFMQPARAVQAGIFSEYTARKPG